MRVARIGRLEKQCLRPRPHAGVEHLGERDIMRVRALVITPADVQAHRFRRDGACRMVDGGDVALGDAQELLVGQLLILVVPRRAEIGRIDLQHETGARNRLVFLLQRVSQRFDIGVFVLVVGVGHEFGQDARRGGIHEGFAGVRGGARSGEVLQIRVERMAIAVSHRPDAAWHCLAGEPRGTAARLDQPLGGIGMIEKVAMGAGLRWLVDFGAAERADAGKTVAHVEGVGDLALLAIANTVDAAGHLLLDDVAHRSGDTRLECCFVKAVAGFTRLEHRQEVGRARQAADMGRQNTVGAELLRCPPLLRLARDCARAHAPSQLALPAVTQPGIVDVSSAREASHDRIPLLHRRR